MDGDSYTRGRDCIAKVLKNEQESCRRMPWRVRLGRGQHTESTYCSLRKQNLWAETGSERMGKVDTEEAHLDLRAMLRDFGDILEQNF